MSLKRLLSHAPLPTPGSLTWLYHTWVWTIFKFHTNMIIQNVCFFHSMLWKMFVISPSPYLFCMEGRGNQLGRNSATQVLILIISFLIQFWWQEPLGWVFITGHEDRLSLGDWGQKSSWEGKKLWECWKQTYKPVWKSFHWPNLGLLIILINY